MPSVPRKRFVISLIVLGILTLLGLELVHELRGPTAAVGYEQIFGERPPVYVRDLRIKYRTHLKGNSIYIGFRAQPEHLNSVLGFDLNDAQVMHFPDIDYYFQCWAPSDTFRELYADDFPDPKTLRIHSIHLPDEIREFVIFPRTGHVFCYRLIDSDIDL